MTLDVESRQSKEEIVHVHGKPIKGYDEPRRGERKMQE